MAELALALTVFLASHAAPNALGLRAPLIERLGRPVYLALYTLLSVALLAWTIAAAQRAETILLWEPNLALIAAPWIATPIACVLFVGAATRPNPLSVSFVGGDLDAADHGPLALTRHPILWAFSLWALGHVAANGDVAVGGLFGLFAFFGLIGMAALDRRARRRMGPAAWAAAAATLGGPPAMRLWNALTPRFALEAVLGLGMAAVFAAAHAAVIGVDPFAALAAVVEM